jgi:NADH:ubiquinone oxidoreductase subunit 5 (subunit L)/multisubunit Na+/H+ antiporter MnhA subunit
MSLEPILLAAAVAVPTLGALALPALGRLSARVRQIAVVALAAVPFLCAAGLVPAALAGAPVTVHAGGIPLLHADALAVFVALASGLLGALIVVYSLGYLAGAEHRGEYDFMVVLFLGAMMGLVFARNLLVLYACWEVTAIACWRLIGFYRERAFVLRADKAFLVTGLGAVTMLLGFVAVYAEAGTLDLVLLRGTPISNLAVGLVLVGLLSKSATLPFHAWLPDAGVAPAPVTALLHAAVLVKIGVYTYARLFNATFVVDPVWSEIVPWIAAASALVAGGAALLESDLKRIIAYSTVSQLGFIFLGFSVGGELASGGALLFILVHAIAKGGLFLCAGVIEHGTHTKDVRRLGGLARAMPVTAVSFALCAFSVMGLPPFGGFFAKHLVLSGAVAAGGLPVTLVFVAGSVLTVAYLLRVFAAVFLGPPGEAVRGHAVHEGSPAMVAVVAVLAALSLASGLLVRWPLELARVAVGAPVDAFGLGLAFRWTPLAVVLSGALGLVALALPALVRRVGALRLAGLVSIVAAAQGAVLADDLGTFLLFLQAMVPPLLLVLLPGTDGRVAMRAFFVAAASDLVVLAGVSILEAGAHGAGGAGLSLSPGGHAGAALALVLGGVLARLGALPPVARRSGTALPAPAAAILAAAWAVPSASLVARAAAELAPGLPMAAALAAGAGSAVLVVTVATAAAVRGAPDPAALVRGALDCVAVPLFAVDRLVNAAYDLGATSVARALSRRVRHAHAGSHALYLGWSLVGAAAIVLLVVLGGI